MSLLRSLSASGARASALAVRRVAILTATSLTHRGAGALVARSFAAAAAPSGLTQTFLDRKEVEDRVLSVLKNFEKVDPAKVTPTAHFANDLGLDSLDAVEVCMALEEEFSIAIPDAEAEKILSAEDAIAFVSTHPSAK